MINKLNNYKINTILAVATSRNNQLLEMLIFTKIAEIRRYRKES